jgi:transposase
MDPHPYPSSSSSSSLSGGHVEAVLGGPFTLLLADGSVDSSTAYDRTVIGEKISTSSVSNGKRRGKRYRF